MKKSDFRPGKKVYIKGTHEVVYMYSFTQDDKFVVCTNDPLGHSNKRSLPYKDLSIKPSKEYINDEKNYDHAYNVLNVIRDVEALHKLHKDNPTYKDTIIELMRPYIGNDRYWSFVLHTTADNLKLHESIKEILTQSKL